MNSFCPFIGSDCKSDCVFRTHKTIVADGEKVCQLSIAASELSDYVYMKTLESENKAANHQDQP